MAWNRSSENGEAVSRPLQKRKGFRFSVKGATAGALVVLGAAIAAWWLWPEWEAQQDAASTKKELIREVTPATAPKVAEKPEKKPFKELSREEQLKYYRDKYGDDIPENLKNVVYFLEHPPQREFKMPKSKYAIFRHPSERSIAGLASMEPGRWMMRAPKYDERFDRDFLEAVLDPIIISDDDTDEDRKLKQIVIDSKKELIDRIKQGERASDIMNETAQQLYKLGQFKRDLESEIRKVKNDATASDDDYKIAVEAANKLLESKGLPPMRMPSLMMRHVSLSRNALKANKKNQNKEKQ